MLSLDSIVVKDIKDRTHECSFNFSEWAENEYKKQFLDINTIDKKIENYKNQILLLEKTKKEILDRQEAYKIGLSRNEKRYIENVPYKISQGMNDFHILNIFNRSFHRKYTSEEFKRLVNEITVRKHDKS